MQLLNNQQQVIPLAVVHHPVSYRPKSPRTSSNPSLIITFYFLFLSASNFSCLLINSFCNCIGAGE